jgi:hypothetical protein
MKRLKHRAAALAVSAWNFKACEQARLRVLGQRAVLRWRRATCKKCFYFWQDQVKIVDDKNEVIVNVPVRLADTATRSAEKHAAPGAVFEMVLDIDFSEIEGKHDDFKNKLMMDLIHSIGCQPSKIEVLQLNPGSIVATILLKSNAFADGKSPNEAIAEMLMQMNDPQSPLMCGQLTSKTKGIKMQDVESIVTDAKIRDQKAAEQMSSLKEHIDAERQALNSKVGALKNELQETKRALALDESGLGRELEQLMQDKHVLLQEKQAWELKEKLLGAETQARASEVSDLKAKLSQLETELQKVITQAAEINNLQKQLAEAANMKATEAALTDKKIRYLDQKLMDAQEKVASSEIRIAAELEVINHEIQELKTRLAAPQREMQAVALKDSEMHGLKVKIADLEKKLTETQRIHALETQEMINGFDFEKLDLHGEVRRLQSELEHTKVALTLDASGLRREIENVLQEKKALLTEKDSMAVKDAEMLKIRNDNDRLKMELQTISRDRDTQTHEMKGTIAEAQKKFADLKHKMNCDAASKEAETHELKTTVANLQKNIKLRDYEAEQLQSSVAKLSKELAEQSANAGKILEQATVARDEEIQRLQAHLFDQQRQFADEKEKEIAKAESFNERERHLTIELEFEKQRALKEELARQEYAQLNNGLAHDVIGLEERASKLEQIAENMSKWLNESNYTGLHLIFSLWSTQTNKNMKKRLRACNLISAMEIKALVSDPEVTRMWQPVSFARDDCQALTGNLQTARMWQQTTSYKTADGQTPAIPPLEMSGRGGARFKAHMFNTWKLSCTLLLINRRIQTRRHSTHSRLLRRNTFRILWRYNVNSKKTNSIACRIVLNNLRRILRGVLASWHRLARLSRHRSIAIDSLRANDLCFSGYVLDLWLCVVSMRKGHRRRRGKEQKEKEEAERAWAMQLETERQKVSLLRQDSLVQVEHSQVTQASYDKRLDLLEEQLDKLTSERDEALLRCAYLEAAFDAAVVETQEKEDRIADLDLTVDAAIEKELESSSKIADLASTLDATLEDARIREDRLIDKNAELKRKVESLQRDLASKEKEILDRESDYGKRIAPLTASLDNALEECRLKEIASKSMINSLSRELDAERTALAAQTEALGNALKELDAQTARTMELSTSVQESTASLAEARNKGTELSQEVAVMAAANKDLKRDLESLQRDLASKEKEILDRDRQEFAVMAAANKDLKRDLEQQRISMQSELSQATLAIARLREERDTAAQREQHVSMHRHVGTSGEMQTQPASNLPAFARAARMMIEHARSADEQLLSAHGADSDDEQASASSKLVQSPEASKLDEEKKEAMAAAEERQVPRPNTGAKKEQEQLSASMELRSQLPTFSQPLTSLPTFASAAKMMAERARKVGVQPLQVSDSDDDSDDEPASASSKLVPASEASKLDDEEEEAKAAAETKKEQQFSASIKLQSQRPAVSRPLTSLPTFASAAKMLTERASTVGAQLPPVSDSDDEQASASSKLVPFERDNEAKASTRGAAAEAPDIQDTQPESRDDVRRRRRQESRQQGRASADFIAALLREAEREEEEEARRARDQKAEAGRRAISGVLASAKLDERKMAHEDVDRPASSPVGVGFAITRTPPFRVTDLVAGGAAARSGSIRVGDYILSVQGVDVTNKPFEEVKKLVLGPAGSDLTLKIDRRTEEGKHNIFSTTITRSAPASQDPEAHSRNRLSSVASLAPGTSLVNVNVVEPSPFPSRPPPHLSLPSRSPAPPPPKFDVSGSGNP